MDLIYWFNCISSSDSLLVTSIRNIKKNIETEKWQEMHKLGYLVYFLIYP